MKSAAVLTRDNVVNKRFFSAHGLFSTYVLAVFFSFFSFFMLFVYLCTCIVSFSCKGGRD